MADRPPLRTRGRGARTSMRANLLAAHARPISPLRLRFRRGRTPRPSAQQAHPRRFNIASPRPWPLKLTRVAESSQMHCAQPAAMAATGESVTCTVPGDATAVLSYPNVVARMAQRMRTTAPLQTDVLGAVRAPRARSEGHLVHGQRSVRPPPEVVVCLTPDLDGIPAEAHAARAAWMARADPTRCFSSLRARERQAFWCAVR